MNGIAALGRVCIIKTINKSCVFVSVIPQLMRKKHGTIKNVIIQHSDFSQQYLIYHFVFIHFNMQYLVSITFNLSITVTLENG